MEDDYDFYEDDFEVEEASGESSRHVSHHFLTPKRHQDKPKKTVVGGTVQNKKKGVSNKVIQDLSPTSRLLSSKDHEIRELRNQLALAQNQLKDSIKENRLIKRLQVRYEKELNTISKQEGELPNILQKHSEEVRALRTQLQRSQLNNSDLQKKIQEMGNEMLKSQDRVKKLDELTKKHNMPAREQLVFQLQELKERYQLAEQRTTKLEYSLELAQKAHKQEVKQLLHKNRILFQQLEGLKEENKVTRWQLKERERLLDVTNIYTQRVQPTANLPPLPMTDNVTTQTPLTHPPFTEAILKTKPVTVVNECQTDSAWLTEILTTKHQTAAPPTDSKITTGLNKTFFQGTPGIIPAGGQKLGSTAPILTATPSIASSTGTVPISVQNPGGFSTTVLQPIPAPTQTLPVPTSTVPTPSIQASAIGPTPIVFQSNTVTASPPNQTGPSIVPTSIINTIHSNSKDDTISELLGLKVTSGSSPPLLPNLKTTPLTTPSPTTTSISASHDQPVIHQSTAPAPKSDEVMKLLFGNQSTTTSSIKLPYTNNTIINTTNTTINTTTTTNTKPNRTLTPKPPAVPIPNQDKKDLLDKLFPKKPESNEITTNTNTSGFSSIISPNTTNDIETTTTITSTNRQGGPFTKRHTEVLKDIEPTSTPPQDNELLKKLFPTQSSKDIFSNPTSSSQHISTGTNSTSNNVTWPERIHNLHHGLPALSTDNDHYGTNNTRRPSNVSDSRRSSNDSTASRKAFNTSDNNTDNRNKSSNRRSFNLGDSITKTSTNTRKPSNSGDSSNKKSFTVGVIRPDEERGAGEGGSVKYGRRARIDTTGPIFGDNEGEEVRGLNPTFGGVSSQGGGDRHTYPWEIPVETVSRRAGQLNSNHSIPPPLQDDDIEEILI